jgi:hypothetical protein
MGTQRVQMKGILPWLVPWAHHAGTVQEIFYPALDALVSSVQKCFPQRTLFQFICAHRPGTWAGSRAGPPVSECVSTVLTGSGNLSHGEPKGRGGRGGQHLWASFSINSLWFNSSL